MLRDLVGADQSLLAPLQHLIGNPSFLALDPSVASRAERLCTRDQLLADMAETYHPTVVVRLRAFLDGYLDLPPADGPLAPPFIWGDDLPVHPPSPQEKPVPPSSSASVTAPIHASPSVAPAPSASPSATGLPSEGAAQQSPAPAASSAAATSPPPGSTSSASPASSPPVAPSSDPDTSAQPSRIPLLLGLSLLAGLGVGLAYRLPALCRPLGLCHAPTSKASEPPPSAKALNRAQQAADAISRARSLPLYEVALTELERELLRLSGDPLTPDQVAKRDRLQGLARVGQQRLKQENKEARAVGVAKGRIDALSSLATERQATEREDIRGVLSVLSHQVIQRPAAAGGTAGG